MPQNVLVIKSTKVSNRLKQSSQLPLSRWKEYQPWPFLGSSGHYIIISMLQSTIENCKYMESHSWSDSDTRASVVKTHSSVCRRLLRITWRWHRSSTSSTVRWAAPSRWDCGIVRLWRGDIVASWDCGVVRLSDCWERNFWTDVIHTCLQTASNVNMIWMGQFSLFIAKFCHVENFFIWCRAMCAFCTHFCETTTYCGLEITNLRCNEVISSEKPQSQDLNCFPAAVV